MFQKILVGTDGFGPASRAVLRAADLAAGAGAELIVLYVEPAPDGASGSPLRSPDQRPGPDAASGLLSDVEKRHGGNVKIRTMVRQGEPAEVLVDVAGEESVDLVVVGNKGMSKRFPLGVVPNQVSHHAPCNVLIVRTT